MYTGYIVSSVYTGHKCSRVGAVFLVFVHGVFWGSGGSRAIERYLDVLRVVGGARVIRSVPCSPFLVAGVGVSLGNRVLSWW